METWRWGISAALAAEKIVMPDDRSAIQSATIRMTDHDTDFIRETRCWSWQSPRNCAAILNRPSRERVHRVTRQRIATDVSSSSPDRGMLRIMLEYGIM